MRGLIRGSGVLGETGRGEARLGKELVSLSFSFLEFILCAMVFCLYVWHEWVPDGLELELRTVVSCHGLLGIEPRPT